MYSCHKDRFIDVVTLIWISVKAVMVANPNAFAPVSQVEARMFNINIEYFRLRLTMGIS